MSEYHLEAAIASLHCTAPTYADTDWPTLLGYYDLLLTLKPSPIVALNRAVVLAEVAGPEVAIGTLQSLTGLAQNHYYQTALGDLYQRTKQLTLARQHYQTALQLTPSAAERRLIEKKMARI